MSRKKEICTSCWKITRDYTYDPDVGIICLNCNDEPMLEKKKYRTVRFEVIPELDEKLENDRLSAPRGERLNKSAHIRKILWEYVERKEKKRQGD